MRSVKFKSRKSARGMQYIVVVNRMVGLPDGTDRMQDGYIDGTRSGLKLTSNRDAAAKMGRLQAISVLDFIAKQYADAAAELNIPDTTTCRMEPADHQPDPVGLPRSIR